MGESSQSSSQQSWPFFLAQALLYSPGVAPSFTLETDFLPTLAEKGLPTFIVDVLFPIKALGAVFKIALIEVDGPHHTLVSQVSHEELQPHQGKDAQAEDGEDHHVREFFYRLDQGPHDGLQP